MLSCLELRHTIESALLPSMCRCTVQANNTLTVEVIRHKKLNNFILAEGIPISSLDSGRSISDFVRHLKQDLRARDASFTVNQIAKSSTKKR